MGIGKGSGRDQTTNVVAGSCCAICCGVCFLVIGLPMLIAGIVLVQINNGKYEDAFDEAFNDNINNNPYGDNYNNVSEADVKAVMYKVGIAMIVISVLCVVAGIIMVICLCTGCCRNSQPSGGLVHVPASQTTVVQQYPAQPNAYYPPNTQQQGYYPPPANNMQHAPPVYNPEVPPAYGEKAAY